MTTTNTANNTTEHDGLEENEGPAPTVEEIIKNDEMTSYDILKVKNKVLAALVKERVESGMPEEEAIEEAKTLLSAVLKQKRSEEMSIEGEFEYDFLKVYMNDSFLGSVSLEITKFPDPKVHTAYIGVRPNGKTHEIIMGYSPKFFRSLSSKERIGVVKHELYHMIFQHIFDRAVGDKSYQVLQNWACFPPGTLLADGTPIESAGKTTYGQSGEVNIIQPMCREYSGNLYQIRAGGMTYSSTDEHPYRVVRRKNNRYPIKLEKPEWIEAKNICPGDYLVVPKLPGSNSEYSISLEPFKGSDEKSRNTMFELNEDTAWLLGLYTAEGSGKDRIALSLGTHKKDIIERAVAIAKTLGYSAGVKKGYQHETVSDVRFGGQDIARAFKTWCGDGSGNKRVPEFILLHSDKNIIRAYLNGLVDGDGWEYQKKNSNAVTIGHGTKSRLLASHVRLLLAKLDIGFNGNDSPQKDRYIGECFVAGGTMFYTTCWTWEPSNSIRMMNGKEIVSYSHSWKVIDEGVLIPVKKVSTIEYVGPVYNIETSDHTYIVDGILVHNCDLSINSIIGKDNLPDMCLIPGKIGINPKTGKEMTGPYAEFIKNAPPLKSSDYYFEELRKIQEEQKKKNNGDDQIEVSIGEGMGTLDDHDQWENLPKEVQDAIRDKVHEMLEQAVKKADRNNDWGSVPHEIQQAIRHILSREIDWRSIVRNFFGRCRTMERISTVRRINKKKPYVFPGVKRKLVANFAVFIDQSGSMSDEDISMLFSELETFAQLTSLDVYHFDTEIDEKSHTVWKKGKAFPKPYRTRCGGTDFQAVADFCNKSENRGKWAGVVILTDGYAPKMGQIVGSKTMWVITEGGTMDTVGENDLCVQMKKDRVFKKRF